MLCKQDRAILCKDCDSSIHSVNELTQKHDRFLLTGVKLSTTSTNSSSSSVSTTTTTSVKSNLVPSSLIEKSTTVSQTSTLKNMVMEEGEEEGSGGSSISKYLIETLPGWQVDDFLDSSSVPFSFSKVFIFSFSYSKLIFFIKYVFIYRLLDQIKLSSYKTQFYFDFFVEFNRI